MGQPFIKPERGVVYIRFNLSGVSYDSDNQSKGRVFHAEAEVRELIVELQELVDPPVYYGFTVWAKAPKHLATELCDEDDGPLFAVGDIEMALAEGLGGMIEEGCEFIVEQRPAAAEANCANTAGLPW